MRELLPRLVEEVAQGQRDRLEVRCEARELLGGQGGEKVVARGVGDSGCGHRHVRGRTSTPMPR